MHLLRLLFRGLIVAMVVCIGVIATAIAALCASIYVGIRRMILPRRAPAPISGRRRPVRGDDREVIDVTATEVPVDPAAR